VTYFALRPQRRCETERCYEDLMRTQCFAHVRWVKQTLG
jgi:hypothetical protein